MTAYNGTTINYDAKGNPLNWRNAGELIWTNDRNLNVVVAPDFNSATIYEYNAEGQRTLKVVGSAETDYFYNGSQLFASGERVYNQSGAMTGYRNMLEFFYDEDGRPMAFCYNWTNFYTYLLNLQGDVVAILDDDFNVVVEYTYSAYGEILSITGSLASTIGQINPLRYRGYYYDVETGFYYLNSRYYDPVVGRFLSPDSIVASTGDGVNGLNMYAYCFNNPVNLSDSSGNWPQCIKSTVKWLAKNIIKPVVKTAQNALSKVDATYSRGINVSGTPGAFIFNLQVGVSIDTKGNVAIQGSAGGGVTGGSPGASITSYQSVTNAPSIDKLEGPGYQIGGSIAAPVYGVPLAAGGDFNIIPDSTLNTTYYGATTNIGFGTPGGEFHVEWGETATWDATRFNIFDVAEDIYISIMEW